MKNTEKTMETKINERVQNCIVKILDFAKAISLDSADMTAGCIALTMAAEIEAYGTEALELLNK